jgi:hypothetical protein
MNASDARQAIVDVQLAGRGIRDKRVLEAARIVPREAFVDPRFAEFAYEDGPLPIGAGQTISQPYIVALMLEAAELGPVGPGTRNRGRFGLCRSSPKQDRGQRLRYGTARSANRPCTGTFRSARISKH